MLEEAEFYNITELIRLVKQRIAEREEKQSQVSERYLKSLSPLRPSESRSRGTGEHVHWLFSKRGALLEKTVASKPQESRKV